MVEWLALAISVLALVVSGLTTWWIHFRRMKLEVCAGGLELSVASSPEGGDPILNLLTDVAFVNTGARAGRVLGARIRVHDRGFDVPVATIPLDGEVTDEQARHSFGTNGVLQPAMTNPLPRILLGRESWAATLWFSSGWDPALDEVQAADVCLFLEVFSDKNRKWEQAQTWLLIPWARETGSLATLARKLIDEQATLVNDPKDAPQ